MTTTTNYEQQAIDFATSHQLRLEIGTPSFKRHFDDDKQRRWVFPCTLSRRFNCYSFEFGQSIGSGNKIPTMYDILACLTKSDPYSYEDFCAEYGYSTFDENTGNKNKASYKIYKAVEKEYAGVCHLFNSDEIEKLQEIN